MFPCTCFRFSIPWTSSSSPPTRIFRKLSAPPPSNSSASAKKPAKSNRRRPFLLQRLRHLFPVRSGFFNYFGLIQRQHAPFPHHHVSADHHRLHVAGLQRIDDLRVHVEHRHGMRRIEPQDNKVRLLPWFQRAYLLFQVQRSRPFDRRHFHGVPGAQRARIHPRHLLQFRCQVHLFHHVQIVVASRRSVCPESQPYPRRAQLRHGRHAARQHHVARRVVHAAHVPRRQ